MPPATDTYGDLAARLGASYGLTPDDWQRLVLDDWLAIDGRRWASLKCGLSCPRQNGKNGILEIRELFGMVGRGEKILHTAHQVKTAQKHFRRLKWFFGKRANDPQARYPELNALVEEIRNVNGQEAIILKNGGSVEIVARSTGSGRGYTVDVIVCDEAQDMSDDDLEALLSSSSAGPKGDPQWIFTGTPPGPNVNGEVFTRNRTEAIEGRGRHVCWHEWSADHEDDFDDPAVWTRANPGLTSGRLLIDVIEGERGTYSEGGFARERLGIWPRDAQVRIIGQAIWDALQSERPPLDQPPTALAVDASHDRVIALAGCWAELDRAHVEILAPDRVADALAAVEWLAERAGRRIPIVIDSASPAASLVPALKARRCRIIQTSATDMGKACGLFYDDAHQHRLTHAGQEPLDEAVAGARKRPIRDAGSWGWDRKSTTTNIAPLVAATLARYGASLSIKRPTGGRVARERTTSSGREAHLL